MILLTATFVVLLILSVPIAFVIGVSALIQLIVHRLPLTLLPLQMVDGVNSFTLLAIPLFIMAGEIMSRSGLMENILEFSNLLVGRLRGGLAHTNIVCSTIFGGISGSAVADVSAIGPVFIPAMEKEGYGLDFSAALTASAAIQDPIIPPSILMVMYGAATGVSVGGLFAGGFLPGFLISAGNMVVVWVLARRRQYPTRQTKIPFQVALRTTLHALPALIMPIVILGGIFGGVLTPTEAAAVAVLYGALLTVFVTKTLKWSDFLPIALVCSKRATIVLFIIAGAQVLGYLFAIMRVPTLISATILSISEDPWVVIMLVNAFLLFVGCFMDAGASIILFTPILAPILHGLGFHPLHAGIVMILAIDIGLITPPVGVCLFAAAAITGLKLEPIIKELVPFIIISVVVLLVITFVPEIVLIVPRLFGFA